MDYHCAACGLLVTRARWAVAINGGHGHVFFNPAGIVFRVLCFREAPGADAVGAPSGVFTWFRGYDWRLALCRGCATHLGWRWDGAEAPKVFFGLIKDRLTATPSPSGEGGSNRPTS